MYLLLIMNKCSTFTVSIIKEFHVFVPNLFVYVNLSREQGQRKINETNERKLCKTSL